MEYWNILDIFKGSQIEGGITKGTCPKIIKEKL